MFVLPSLLGVALFWLIPYGDVVRRSFYSAVSEEFTGISNYQKVFENQAFRLAAGNTLRFFRATYSHSGSPVPWESQCFFPNRGNGCRCRKACFFFPWRFRWRPWCFCGECCFTARDLPNHLCAALSLPAVDWMNSEASFWMLVISYIWRNLGYDVVLWIAGLSAIPNNIYEAARVDGAGEWMCFWRITLPYSFRRPSYTIAVLSLLNGFKVFREAYLVAGDYPQEKMYLLQHLFNNWYRNMDFDKMAAAAVITG